MKNQRHRFVAIGLVLCALASRPAWSQCQEALQAIATESKLIDFVSLDQCPSEASSEIFSELSEFIYSSIDSRDGNGLNESARFMRQMYFVYREGPKEFHSRSVGRAIISLVSSLPEATSYGFSASVGVSMRSDVTQALSVLERIADDLDFLSTEPAAAAESPVEAVSASENGGGQSAQIESNPSGWKLAFDVLTGTVLVGLVILLFAIRSREKTAIQSAPPSSQRISPKSSPGPEFALASDTTSRFSVLKERIISNENSIRNISIRLRSSIGRFEENAKSVNRLQSEMEGLKEALALLIERQDHQELSVTEHGRELTSLKTSWREETREIGKFKDTLGTQEKRIGMIQSRLDKAEDLRVALAERVSSLVEEVSSLVDQMSSLGESTQESVERSTVSLYSIHKIDNHLQKSRAHLLLGEAAAAEEYARRALYGSSKGGDSRPPEERGAFPPASSGTPHFVAAAHPESGYPWGEASARQLLAEALLLAVAQKLGRSDFVPARVADLPPDIQAQMGDARSELRFLIELRQESQDPKIVEARQILSDLEGGILTKHPLVQHLMPREENLADSGSRSRDLVFVSYSRKDRGWLLRLQTILKPLVRQGVSTWDDTVIESGSDWREEIRRALSRASVAVLLVSKHFLASDFIAEEELPPLLEAAETEGVRILWVYVGYCLWESTPIGDYQAAHEPTDALASMPRAEQDRVLADVGRQIRQVLIEKV